MHDFPILNSQWIQEKPVMPDAKDSSIKSPHLNKQPVLPVFFQIMQNVK